MSDQDTIRAVAVIETEYGEKLAIESPYDAKEFIGALPWQTLDEEVSEHGSFRAKLEERDVDPAIIDGVEDFEFSGEFAAHATWDGDALGDGEGAWLIDVDAWDEASDWFEYAGYEVEVSPNVML